ncbi:MAG TPA: malto-oligosyltrehalose trehalohydrolase [Bacteroidales bacterium]|nr:malto-oligosyltrehalose trehalohydrolase [Bacteroidales bacterium]
MIYNTDRRTLGLNFIRQADPEFLLWAPFAEKVELQVNDAVSLDAEKEDFGYWSVKDNLTISPGDNYMIRLNGQGSYPDPASLYQPENVHGKSQAYDLSAFGWQDNDWKGLQEENIIYELHTGTFSEQGTFSGIAGKIGYLKDLGINTIEIMPVGQFPGSRNWGYDGVLVYSVQNSYGGPLELQKLVNLCHLNGIAVILDVVYNHLGPEGNYLSMFGQYFTDNYKTPWGSAINFDSEWCDGVRRYYIENMLMWFRDFHIDGLRLDAVHAIKDFSAKHILKELRENADELEKQTGRKYMLIAELDLNDVKYLVQPTYGGYGLDKQWCDEWHHAIHSLVTGERNGYYSDFGKTFHLVKSFNDAYVYDGVWSEHRKRTFGSSTRGIDKNRFVIFTQNHDHIGNRMLGERLGRLIDFESLKLVAAAMFISPFTPMIFMGEEYNAPNPFLYFTSHSDEELSRLVSQGRKSEFQDFLNSETFPEPQDEAVFNKSVLKFENSGMHRYMMNYYRELIRLRKYHHVIKKYDSSEARQSGDMKAIVFSGIKNGKRIIAIMNFEDQLLKISNSGYRFTKDNILINSASEIWGGPIADRDSQDVIADDYIKVNQRSVIIFSDKE